MCQKCVQSLTRFYTSVCAELAKKRAPRDHVVYELLRFRGFVSRDGIKDAPAEELRTYIRRLMQLFDNLSLFNKQLLSNGLKKMHALQNENKALKEEVARLRQELEQTKAVSTLVDISRAVSMHSMSSSFDMDPDSP